MPLNRLPRRADGPQGEGIDGAGQSVTCRLTSEAPRRRLKRMSRESEPFEELLARARAGDVVAWEQVFSRLADEGHEGAEILEIARRILPMGDRARDFVESRDLLQSALRSGWFHAEDFRGESKAELLGWIRSILRRKLGRVLRRRTPRPGGDPVELESRAAAPGGSEDSVEPVAKMLREEVQGKVREAVERLPEDLRDVLRLRLEGLRAPDVAGMLGLSHDAVRKRESRAMAKLREALGETGKG